MTKQIEIVTGSDSSEVQKRINELLSQGWELKGELLVNRAFDNKYDIQYTQVMTLLY